MSPRLSRAVTRFLDLVLAFAMGLVIGTLNG